MTYNHWRELIALLNDIIKEYEETLKSEGPLKKMDHQAIRLKKGNCIHVGYKYKPYDKTNALYLTPRTAYVDDDDDDTHELTDKGGCYMQLVHCSSNLIVSVCPCQSSDAEPTKVSVMYDSPQQQRFKLRRAIDARENVVISDYFSSVDTKRKDKGTLPGKLQRKCVQKLKSSENSSESCSRNCKKTVFRRLTVDSYKASDGCNCDKATEKKKKRILRKKISGSCRSLSRRSSGSCYSSEKDSETVVSKQSGKVATENGSSVTQERKVALTVEDSSNECTVGPCASPVLFTRVRSRRPNLKANGRLCMGSRRTTKGPMNPVSPCMLSPGDVSLPDIDMPFFSSEIESAVKNLSHIETSLPVSESSYLLSSLSKDCDATVAADASNDHEVHLESAVMYNILQASTRRVASTQQNTVPVCLKKTAKSCKINSANRGSSVSSTCPVLLGEAGGCNKGTPPKETDRGTCNNTENCSLVTASDASSGPPPLGITGLHVSSCITDIFSSPHRKGRHEEKDVKSSSGYSTRRFATSTRIKEICTKNFEKNMAASQSVSLSSSISAPTTITKLDKTSKLGRKCAKRQKPLAKRGHSQDRDKRQKLMFEYITGSGEQVPCPEVPRSSDSLLESPVISAASSQLAHNPVSSLSPPLCFSDSHCTNQEYKRVLSLKEEMNRMAALSHLLKEHEKLKASCGLDSPAADISLHKDMGDVQEEPTGNTAICIGNTEKSIRAHMRKDTIVKVAEKLNSLTCDTICSYVLKCRTVLLSILQEKIPNYRHKMFWTNISGWDSMGSEHFIVAVNRDCVLKAANEILKFAKKCFGGLDAHAFNYTFHVLLPVVIALIVQEVVEDEIGITISEDEACQVIRTISCEADYRPYWMDKA